MYKAYKFRLYPNDQQKQKLNKTFGCNRFVYNYYLRKIISEGYINAYSCIKDYTNKLKYEYPFLLEANPLLIKKTIFNLQDNYKRHLNSGISNPKYRSKYGKNSYTIKAIYNKYCNIELDLISRTIKLPELEELKISGYRNITKINGKITNVTISKDKNSKYYVSILYELPEPLKIKANTIVGIDLGIKKLITMSDNTSYDNNKYINKYEEQIKREHYKLSKKNKRSQNYYKNLKRLNKLYSKLSNARKYYIHKITKEITDNYDIIITESLNIKKMIMDKNINLSKKINDATFREILKQLEYKSKEKGKYFFKINTYYPSSQTCSVCDNIDKKYKNLNERDYVCQCCKNTLDRNLNASINIMFEGLKLYMKKVYSKYQ